MKKFSAVFLAPAFFSAFVSAAQAQETLPDAISYDENNAALYACKDAQFSTDFANTYWNLSCEDGAKAEKLLNEAPKVAENFNLPLLGDPLRDCIDKNFPQGPEDNTLEAIMIRQPDFVNRGEWAIPFTQFKQVVRAVAFACTPTS